MKRLFLLVLIAVTLSPVPGFCGERFSFKGIKTGDDYVRLAQRFGKCSSGENSYYKTDDCLVGKETIAGVPAEILLEFYGEKLAWIAIRFKSEEFSTVLSALESKYGEGEKREKLLQNRMGLVFKNIMVTWKNDIDEMTLNKYEGDIKHSWFRIKSYSAKKEFEKRFKEEKKKRAKDL